MRYARLGLAVAGFMAALLSVALNDPQIGWGAIALLTGSLIVRLLSGKREDRNSRDGGL
jgi:uncharacterized oligopeptide transporter (OPT) family protein